MRDPVARFWKKVDRRGPDECWPWTANRNPDGYGRFWFNNRLDNASRVTLFIAGIEPPTREPPTSHGWCALHSCDNPGCVNPAHLFWGTQPQNNKDRMIRGRSGSSKISAEDALKIRLSPLSIKELAAKYGLAFVSVWRIKNNQAWTFL